MKDAEEIVRFELAVFWQVRAVHPIAHLHPAGKTFGFGFGFGSSAVVAAEKDTTAAGREVSAERVAEREAAGQRGGLARPQGRGT